MSQGEKRNKRKHRKSVSGEHSRFETEQVRLPFSVIKVHQPFDSRLVLSSCYPSLLLVASNIPLVPLCMALALWRPLLKVAVIHFHGSFFFKSFSCSLLLLKNWLFHTIYSEYGFYNPKFFKIFLPCPPLPSHANVYPFCLRKQAGIYKIIK